MPPVTTGGLCLGVRKTWMHGLVIRKIDMDNVIRVLVAGFLLFGAVMIMLVLLGDYFVGIP